MFILLNNYLFSNRRKHHYFLFTRLAIKKTPSREPLIISGQVSYNFSCMLRAKYDRLVEFYLVYLSMSSFAY